MICYRIISTYFSFFFFLKRKIDRLTFEYCLPTSDDQIVHKQPKNVPGKVIGTETTKINFRTRSSWNPLELKNKNRELTWSGGEFASQASGKLPKFCGQPGDFLRHRSQGILVVVTGQESPGDGHQTLSWRGHRRQPDCPRSTALRRGFKITVTAPDNCRMVGT